MQTKDEIVKNWLPRYTGTPLEEFKPYILLTNFSNYVKIFAEKFGGGAGKIFPDKFDVPLP